MADVNTQLVEIQPRGLKFVFEVKKQSSCVVHLVNVTAQYVAFKIKTTSPKKYCVKPSVGIIKPKSAYDFTVIMQAQKSAPLDMSCKDKFLIQCTVVPFGTTEEEITPGMFAKESLNYIEETKLRVVLISPPSSPARPEADLVPKQEASYETFKPNVAVAPFFFPVSEFSKQEQPYETSVPKENLQIGVEKSPLPDLLTKQVEAVNIVKDKEEPTSLKVVDSKQTIPDKDEEFSAERDDKSNEVRELEEAKLKLIKDIEDLTSKISAMDTKLLEAQHTVEKLKEEKINDTREKETLRQDLAILKTKSGTRKIQVGFPPLFVCMVALIFLMIGSSFRG